MVTRRKTSHTATAASVEKRQKLTLHQLVYWTGSLDAGHTCSLHGEVDRWHMMWAGRRAGRF